MTVRARFRRLLDEAPDAAEAIEIDGSWTTWGTLRAISRQLDAVLAARELGHGARIGMVLESRPEHVGAALSIIASGRCLVTFSPLQPAVRLAEDIREARVPVVIGSAEVLAEPLVVEAMGETVPVVLANGSVSDAGGPGVRSDVDLAPGVTVEMLTSGTTGRPKRIPITDRQFDTALVTSVPPPPRRGLFRSGVAVVTTPLVHIGGFWGALGQLYSGRRIVLMPKFVVDTWVEVVRKHRPKAVGLVPAGLRALLDADIPPADLEGVEVATIGTAHCPPELIDAFLERYGIRVLPVYGATEFAGAVAGWSAADHEAWWERKKGSAGRPLPGAAMRVVDGQGDELPSGEVGRLEVRSGQSAAGPLGWVRTNDLAAIDADGFLWIHGRADDVIIRGGFKIDPAKVGSVLESHPAVREAAVAPLPDDRLGQVPVAAVELAADGTTTVQELRQLCRERLLPYEVPTVIVIVDELPRTPSSKVSRLDVLQLVTPRPEQKV